jgi:hypothetical protein
LLPRFNRNGLQKQLRRRTRIKMWEESVDP